LFCVLHPSHRSYFFKSFLSFGGTRPAIHKEKAIIEEAGGEDVVVLKKKDKKKEGENKK